MRLKMPARLIMKTALFTLLCAGQLAFQDLSFAQHKGAACDEEVIRVLAIRVNFSPDTLVTTTGVGLIDAWPYDTAAEDLLGDNPNASDSLAAEAVAESVFRFDHPTRIDRLPHDKSYFEDQLAFLAHYYDRVSQGNVRIEAEVWPLASTQAYELDHPMWHYNYNQSRAQSDEQLAWLFQDAWMAADADDALEFFDENGQLRFDSFILFHAGVGQDFGLDGTPHDISSAWLSSEDLLGEEIETPGQVSLVDIAHERTDGTWYAGGAGALSQGLILPESENHESFEHALAGLVVLQFAHELGMPNLYDGTTGQSVIGKWGLMDQGSANFRGLLPALPSAWTRLNMGWDEPVLLTQPADSLLIGCLTSESDLPRMYKVPLSEGEFFLIENRLRDRAGLKNPDGLASTWARDAAGNWALLDENYQITYTDTTGLAGDTCGVFVEVGDLDFDLPGSGLLIWHVDESQITESTIAENTVNNNPQRRGVSLEEADGIVDIGEDYVFFHPRASVALGGAEDCWQDVNHSWALVNDHLNANEVQFSTNTFPPSTTNDEAATGLRFSEFSKPGESMSFSLDFDFRGSLDGSPLLPSAAEGLYEQVQLGSFEFDAEQPSQALLALTDQGSLYALTQGSLATWPRADGYQSLLPSEWQEGLRGVFSLGSNGLLAWRGDSLANFTAMGDPQSFVISYQLSFPQPLTSVLVQGAGDLRPLTEDWLGGPSGILRVVSGQMLFTLDAVTLEVIGGPDSVTPGSLQMADIAGGPGILIDDDFQRLILNGELVLEGSPGENVLPSASKLIALNPHAPFVHTMEGESDYVNSDYVTAVLAHDGGAWLYHNANETARIDCPNAAVRPVQHKGDRALELAFLTPAAEVLVYSEKAIELTRFSLDLPDSIQASDCKYWLTGSARAGENGFAVHVLAFENFIMALDAEGHALPTWPRQHTLDLASTTYQTLTGELVSVDETGTLVSMQLPMEGLVWKDAFGTMNQNHRPFGQGVFFDQDSPSVSASKAFVWPNPAAELAHFQIPLEDDAIVYTSIFDLAGDVRVEMESLLRADGSARSELLWNTASVSPGGYVARIECHPLTGGPTHTYFVKCAVIR
jgi:M6 family metalloprotease-like protein